MRLMESERGSGCARMGRQPFDLIDVEDGIGLQEGDGAFELLAGARLLRPGDLVGVDDEGALLALAGMRLELQGLLESESRRS